MRNLLLVLLLSGCIYAPSPSPRGSIFLPIASTRLCPQTTEPQTIVNLLVNDTRQERPVMRCNEALVSAARTRALSMATLGYVAHCDPSGLCPNQVAKAAGCTLPSNYSKNGNNIESLIVGPNDAAIAYQTLALSPSHAQHLFGIGSFFKNQPDYGIAALYAPGSKFGYYYVFLIGRCV